MNIIASTRRPELPMALHTLAEQVLPDVLAAVTATC
jgi:hypothetical protein